MKNKNCWDASCFDAPVTVTYGVGGGVKVVWLGYTEKVRMVKYSGTGIEKKMKKPLQVGKGPL